MKENKAEFTIKSICYSEFECTNFTQNFDHICDKCKNRELRTIENDDEYNNLVTILSQHYKQKYEGYQSGILKGKLLYNKIDCNYEICLIERLDTSVEVTLVQILNKSIESINAKDLFNSIIVIVYDELDVKSLINLLK